MMLIITVFLALSFWLGNAQRSLIRVKDGRLSYSNEYTCGLSIYEQLAEEKWNDYLSSASKNSSAYIGDEEKRRSKRREIYESTVPASYRVRVPDIDPSQLLYQDNYSKLYREKLKQEIVPIRLNIVYDRALLEDLRSLSGGALGYIRNMIYDTQLFFEQPEIWARVKLLLVVVRLKQLSNEIPSSRDASEILKRLHENQYDYMNKSAADLNLILLRRNIWLAESKPEQKLLLQGLADMAAFCGLYEQTRQLIIKAQSYNSVTLAHELAHTLNVPHDGESRGRFSGSCSNEQFIMSPTSGPGKLTWSECSVTAISEYLVGNSAVRECTFNRDRLASAKPISKEFDFHPDRRRSMKLPGEQVKLDEQCQVNFDLRVTKSAPDDYYTQFETCQMLMCRPADKERLLNGVGPAVSGSRCVRRNDGSVSICKNRVCI